MMDEETIPEAPKADPKPKAKKRSVAKEPQISFDQFIDGYHPEVSIYTRAYVGAKYHGIMKTRTEWESDLDFS